MAQGRNAGRRPNFIGRRAGLEARQIFAGIIKRGKIPNYCQKSEVSKTSDFLILNPAESSQPAQILDRLEIYMRLLLRSGQVEAVSVHDFVPGCDKIVHKLFLGVVLGVNFRQGSQL